MLHQAPRILQIKNVILTADTTTSSTTFVDLNSISITLISDSNPLICLFTAAGDASAAAVLKFQLVIDGTAIRQSHGVVTAAGYGQGSQIYYKSSNQTAGTHVVKIQWLTSAGTGRIRPVTNLYDHASLIVKEVLI